MNIDVDKLKGKALTDKAAELGIEGRSKMKAGELREAIKAVLSTEDTTPEVEQTDDSKATTLVPNRADMRRRGFRNNRKVKPAVTGKVMGLHYRGRALGAKHFKLMRDAQAASQGGRIVRSGTRTVVNPDTPMPASERVQKYVKQNGTRKLTVAQSRQVRRNAEGLLFSRGLPELTAENGWSNLATLADGRHVFYQFSTASV